MANAYNVLVVDDEPPIRRFLRASLSAAGHRVVTADDAAGALAAVAAEKPDLTRTRPTASRTSPARFTWSCGTDSASTGSSCPRRSGKLGYENRRPAFSVRRNSRPPSRSNCHHHGRKFVSRSAPIRAIASTAVHGSRAYPRKRSHHVIVALYASPNSEQKPRRARTRRDFPSWPLISACLPAGRAQRLPRLRITLPSRGHAAAGKAVQLLAI